jgi:hypothetical protein
MLFTMSIASTAGYPEAMVRNDYERIIFILVAYIGNGLFALAFGLVAANLRTLPEKFENIFGTVT